MVKSAVQPLDELAETLGHMFAGDLKMEIKAYTVCPADISALYQVFDKLKVALRFGDLSFFNCNPATAEINLCQALQLFQQFKNDRGAGQCWWHLGHLHAKCGRLQEARKCFQAALEIAQFHKESQRSQLVADRSYMLAVYSDNQTALPLLQAAAMLYEDRPLCEGKAAMAMYQLCKVQISLGLWEEAVETHERLQGKIAVLGSEILIQKERFLAARLAEERGDWQQAGELYTEALTCSSVTDPAIRTEALERLRRLLDLNGLDTAHIQKAIHGCSAECMDVVFVLDGCKAPSLALLIFDSLLREHDRVAAVRWNRVFKVVFPLSEKGGYTYLLRAELGQAAEQAEDVRAGLSLACKALEMEAATWSFDDQVHKRRKVIAVLSERPLDAEAAELCREAEVIQLSENGEAQREFLNRAAQKLRIR